MTDRGKGGPGCYHREYMNQSQPDIEEILLLKFLKGETGDPENEAVMAWLDEDPAHRYRLEKMEAVWIESGKLVPVPVVVDVDKAWLTLTDRIDFGEEPSEPVNEQSEPVPPAVPERISPRRIRLYTFRIAASLLILVGIYFLLFRITRKDQGQQIYAAQANRTDTLSDGSVVTLKKGSFLLVNPDFGDDSRAVILTGEAYFKVRPDERNPFVVEAGDARIRVVGTEFAVKNLYSDGVMETVDGNGSTVQGGDVARNPLAKPAAGAERIDDGNGGAADQLNGDPGPRNRNWLETDVSVTTGKVMLFRMGAGSRDTLSVILTAGMTGRLKKGCNSPELTAGEPPDRLFWFNRSLVFQQTTLKEVIFILHKYYSVDVLTDHPGILDCRLNARFQDEEPAEILRVVAASFGLELKSAGRRYLLSGPGCTGKP